MCGRYQLNADFFNTLERSRKFAALDRGERGEGLASLPEW
jgi:hypothetical protein